MSRFHKNRKGFELSLLQLVEIVLAVIIILALLYLGLQLASIFFSNRDFEVAGNNMLALSERIKEVTLDQGNTKRSIVYSIPEDYILVGFSYDDKGTIKTDCTQETIKKPNSCQSKACLCIYKNYGGITDPKGYDFDNRDVSSPLKCTAFDQKIVFMAQPKDTNFLGSNSNWQISGSNAAYTNLVLYGICGGPWRTKWGIKELNIKKIVENANNFIIISELKPKSN